MSKWKDNAHLFANGKFKCLYNHIGKDWVAEIRGIDMSGFIIKLEPLKTTRTSHFEYCTLIARKIEDMTDDEIYEMTQSDPVNARDYLKGGTLNGGILSGRYLLHLLSIGVYPFDQNSFNNGEVIDAKTV